MALDEMAAPSSPAWPHNFFGDLNYLVVTRYSAGGPTPDVVESDGRIHR